MAFLWRGLYLSRLLASPLGESLTEDSAIYWSWSGSLLAHGLIGTHPFFLGPLYPYLLAGLRVLTGDSIAAVLWIQMAWGTAAAVLLADAARRLTRPAIGIATGLLVALYEMAVFFDGLVLMESLLFFLEAVLLWRMVRMRCDAPRLRDWVLLGLLVGLLAEGRALYALLLAPAAWFAIECGTRARRVAQGAALLAGFLLVTTPVAVRNLAVSGEWIPFTYNSGFNLYVGNNPDATGGSVHVTRMHESRGMDRGRRDGGAEADGREYLEKEEGLRLSPAASSRHWTSKAIAHARAHPAETARGTLRKLKMMWNRREYPQIENADEYRSLAGPLGVPGLGSFALLGMLGLAGLVLAWRAGPRERFLAGYCGVLTLGILPFFVVDRYRHHLVPAVALLAAITIARVAAARTSRSQLLRVAAALAVGATIVHLPAPELGSGHYAWAAAADLGSRWLERGRPDLALVEMERAALALRHDRVTRSSALERGGFFHNYGIALTRVGRYEEALEWFERAAHTAPNSATIVRAFADASRAAGRASQADSLERRLPDLVGGEPRLLGARAWNAARSGDLEGAAGLFEQALLLDSGQYDCWVGLIRARIEMKQPGAAEAALGRARAAGLPRAPGDAYEALLAAQRGEDAAANRALARIPGAALGDSSVAEAVRITRRLLSR